MCHPQMGNTVVYPLQTLRNQTTGLPDLNPWIIYVDMLCSQLHDLFNRIEVSGKTFVWAVDSFTLILRLFSDNINRFVVEVRSMSQAKPIA